MIPVPKKSDATPSTVEAVLMRGDLSKLTEEQRLEYYNSVCKSLGLNPLTLPFSYIMLNGKLTLYATRACTDQLRKLNGISTEIVSQEFAHGLLTVHVKAKDSSGRTDEDLGVVAFPDTLRGEVAANQILKCVTKAKRRVTLSLSGLGYLDETEIEDIPAAAKAKPEPSYVVELTQTEEHRPDWRGFATALLTAIREDGQVMPWLKANEATLETMKTAVPKMHANLMKAMGESADDDEIETR